MAKVTLAVAPTFKSVVEIPGPAGKSLKIEFVFKHRTQTELDKWRKSVVGEGDDAQRWSDPDLIMSMAEGWTNVEEPFNAESVETLCQNYCAAGTAVVGAYLEDLVRGRKGN